MPWLAVLPFTEDWDYTNNILFPQTDDNWEMNKPQVNKTLLTTG